MFVALIALLLPVVGPAVDHHFFERFAVHAHVYLDEPVLDHGHYYDADSENADVDSGSFVATSGDGPSTRAITFLVVDSASSNLHAELEDGILGRPGDEFERPTGIVISLPEKPPRTDSPLKYMESVGRIGIG